ncbi:unnamed protein product [Durusdinium trenchii]|uniref:Uncharacterized protein n=1 Tax=Durusdinium trenchii TaxID=1381693 RepID=A0ABP0IRI7_9DINO
MDAVKETLKAVQSREQGGAPIKELTELLEIECKARKNDVDELRHQLQLTESLVSGAASAPVHQSLEDLDLRMTRLVSALETERDHRRSDSERHHAALSDVMDSLKAERSLRGNEVEKMRSALAQLAMNLQQASESSEPSRWVDAFASLQSALDADRSERPETSERSEAPQARGGSQTVRVRMQARMEPLTSKSERSVRHAPFGEGHEGLTCREQISMYSTSPAVETAQSRKKRAKQHVQSSSKARTGSAFSVRDTMVFVDAQTTLPATECTVAQRFRVFCIENGRCFDRVLAQDSSNMTVRRLGDFGRLWETSSFAKPRSHDEKKAKHGDVAAKLRGEVAAKSAECRGDVAALRSEMLKKMDGASPTRRDGLAPGGRRIERWRLRAAVERGAGWADDRDGQVGADHRAKHRALGGEAL